MNSACIRRVFPYVLVFCIASMSSALLLIPAHLHGQIETSARLSLDPANPAPGDNVRVSVDAYALNTNGSSIRWYIDGIEDPTARNARSITVQAGGIGDSMRVRADVAPPGSAALSLTTTIVPTVIDLIVEANTRTPAFYKGAALPAPDEPVTAVVIPFVGTDTNAAALVYTWRLGNNVLFGGPVVGKTRAAITMPKRRSVLSVEVTTRTGTAVGDAAVVLEPADAELYFYEDNPLRGLSTRAIGDTLTLVGDETTIRAEPYFIHPDVFTLDPAVEWTLDNQPISPGELLNTLTLRGNSGSGQVRVGFSLTNRQSLLQSVRGSFGVFFE